jgi:hypothetical protein
MKKSYRGSSSRGMPYIVITGRKANVIGHILHRNFLVKHEGKIEVMGRRKRIRKQLLDEFKEKRGYCKLKGEAIDRTL